MNVAILLALTAVAMATPGQRDLDKINFRDIEFPEILNTIENHKNTRIVGGDMATPHSFPFMAHVITTIQPSGTAHCGGTVLNSEWILTAAHCLDSTVYPADVDVGLYTIYEDDGSAVSITSFDLFQHPGWNKTTRENDIALIKLVEKIKFNAYVQPIRLPSRSEQSETYVGRQATVIGWGRTSDSAEELSDEQRYVKVPVITNSNCSARFGEGNITDTHICTSGVGGKNPCNGDSGGPLVIEGSDGNLTQIGIVSYGENTCTTGYPSVYTKVSSYLDWISTTTGITIG